MHQKEKHPPSYANSKQQLLAEHSFAVGKLAQIICTRFFDITEHKALADGSYIAGCMHDIGKNEPNFQNWLQKSQQDNPAEDGVHITADKFSFEKYPRHNEISVLIYQLLDATKLSVINPSIKQIVKHVIRWHHELPFRANNIQQQFTTYAAIIKKLENNKIDIKSLVNDAILLLEDIAKIECDYSNNNQNLIARCYQPTINSKNTAEELPTYKNYATDCNSLENFLQESNNNSTANIIRACVITADRWISSLPAIELNKFIINKQLANFAEQQFIANGLSISSNLTQHIATCLNNFPQDDRTKEQTEVAKNLVDDSEYIKILAGAAGCGKTKIALEWAKNTNAQQIIWICPRVQICQGLFNDLTNEQYLPNATIEIYTGEYKYTNNYDTPTKEENYFKANIVITTIDQILNTIISHTKVDRLLNYLSAHIVFDEFHEYITMPAFNLLFAELVIARKKLIGGSKALLVSATPNYAYLKQFLDIDNDVIEMPSFNACKYQFEFVEYDENKLYASNPLYKPQDTSSFIISNTAKTAQLSFLKNAEENAILFHSKFRKNDKKELFKKIFNSFKQNGNNNYDILRSGPVIQASLNISCDHMTTEITTAENTLQRLGRLDRFGNNKTSINKLTIAIAHNFTNNKKPGDVAKFLAKTNCLKTTQAWYKFLYKETDQGKKVLSLKKIYALYKSFYQQPELQACIKQDLLAAMQQSAKLIVNKVNAPIRIVKAKDNSKRVKIAAKSLRGDNRFVQLAVCDLTDITKPVFKDEYAYEIPDDELADINNITESLEKIRALKLLEHAAKTDSRINVNSEISAIPATQSASREAVIANLARNPEQPIYLSYIPSDLAKLGNRKNHSNAVVYIITNRQPVGSLLLKEINNAKN